MEIHLVIFFIALEISAIGLKVRHIKLFKEKFRIVYKISF